MEDRSVEVMIRREIDTVAQQPLVVRQALEALGRVGIAWTFGDVDVHTDSVLVCECRSVRERFVGARERCVDADEADALDAALTRDLHDVVNWSLYLSRDLMDRGISPPVDVRRSHTRRAARLLTDDE